MCGIVGIWDFKKNTISESLINSMRDSLSHRGPDDAGIFLDKEHNLALGHRRLSIIDLTSQGHQPMANDDGNLWIIYNGEVYNYKEIKEELETKGHRFKSNSDTEVILKAYEEWGVDAVHKFRGMFTFAIWDKSKEKLFIFRDRAGVKPLYYYFKNYLFLFASELKAFHRHPNFEKEINSGALALFLQFGYIQAPYTIFSDTFKLRPGHYLEIDKNGNLKEVKYWDIIDHYLAEPINKTEEEIEKELEQLLIESFKYRLVADVPVGVFLSGGLDSSIVTALLQFHSSNPIKTFTIGFEEKEYNEAPHAKRVAEYLKTDHYELYCTAKEALGIIPKLAEIYDEPFGDSSGIPTYLVSKFAREKVKVALSADGGDELFCGYTRYGALSGYYKKIEKIPSFLLSIFSSVLFLFSTNNIDGMYNIFCPILPKQTNLKDKIYKFKNVVRSKDRSLSQIVRMSYSFWLENQLKDLLKINYGPLQTNFSEFERVKNLDVLSQMQAIDFKTYMTDDILTKVDRATMAASLEGREPLIDHKIAEYVAKIPRSLKYRNGKSKYILRKILYKYVPKELLERPKQGFGIPIYQWLSNDLSELLREYLSFEKLKKQGIFDPNYVKNITNRYLEEKSELPHKLWFLLMFQMWYYKWIENN